MTDQPCPSCNGLKWICEKHPWKPWPHGKCVGPGMPCECSIGEQPKLPAGSKTVFTKDGYVQ